MDETHYFIRWHDLIFTCSYNYYFRFKKGVYDPEIMTGIFNLGHEIGYHYEVLSETKGDSDKAIKLFEKQLSEFRQIIPVNTICMHGSPMYKWNELDLWNFHDFSFASQ